MLHKLSSIGQGNLGYVKNDLAASLGVFVVALPLSLGIALASGLEPGAGLIGAFVGGVVVGLLSGAPLVVTGPAAGLAALVFQIVQTHGVTGLLFITAIAGLLQILMGAARIGKIFTLVPTPLLKGLLAAIGLMILLSQLHILMGSNVPKNSLTAISSFPTVLAASLTSKEGQASIVLGITGIAIMLLWPKIAKKWANVPSALPAIIIVTLLALPLMIDRVKLGALFASGMENAKHLWTLDGWTNISVYLASAVGLAVIASAETLLTAKAVDTMTAERPNAKPSDLNRELMAQGTGNIISAFLGALPLTGVIVRSAANIQFGASTRLSTILHGVWIALFVLALPSVLETVPLTGLAAILILTGYKLLDFEGMKATFAKNKRDGLLWVFTLAAIVLTDLLLGLVLSLAIAIPLQHEKVKPVANTALQKLRLKRAS